MSEIELSLQTYRAQLEQVKLALSTADDSSKDELEHLVSDLQELISITEENLLEVKRKELLALFADSDDENEKKDENEQNVGHDNVQEAEPEPEPEPEPPDFSSLEGVKCRAPHSTSHSGGHTTFHNGIIFACESTSSSFEDVHVRVVFSHPTQVSMLPCPFFLDGKCRFSDDKCKFSHGEVVPLASLKEYEEPDFTRLKEGLTILAKDCSDQLWHHATVEGVEGSTVHLRFSHNSQDIHSLPLEMVFPMETEDEYEENFDEETEDDFVPTALEDHVIGCASGPLGDWEQYTRGIGSKLMVAMGYVMGSGLGKSAEGRIEPVPAMLYPVGKSLDWCMNLREKAGGGDAISVEKSLKRLQAREERKVERRLAAEKNNETVFEFINQTLGGKRGDLKDIVSQDAFMRKGGGGKVKSSKNPEEKRSNHLNVESLKVSEEIRRTLKEVERLRDSHSRLKARDPTSAKAVAAKLKAKEESLRALHSHEKSISSKQSSQNEKRKLTIF